jgi:Mn-dependent DtxR family transcriptional regulator
VKPILIKTIPHRKQRLKNGDIADYVEISEKTVIATSDLGSADFNFLVQVHEFVELFLIQKAGIAIKDIDDWDCKHPDTMGDNPKAPYHVEHCKAEQIERFAAKVCGISWTEYNKTIERM